MSSNFSQLFRLLYHLPLVYYRLKVISGINVGYASGPVDIHSSAVSSVLTSLGKDIPSFCVLTNLSEDIDDDEHFGHASSFAAHLVDVFVDKATIFPIGVGLKIGYPARLPADIPQALLAGHGHYNPFGYSYYKVEGEENTYQLGPAASVQSEHADSDAVLVNEGNIAALPITNDISLKRHEDNEWFMDDLERILSEVDSRFLDDERRRRRA